MWKKTAENPPRKPPLPKVSPPCPCCGRRFRCPQWRGRRGSRADSGFFQVLVEVGADMWVGLGHWVGVCSWLSVFFALFFRYVPKMLFGLLLYLIIWLYLYCLTALTDLDRPGIIMSSNMPWIWMLLWVYFASGIGGCEEDRKRLPCGRSQSSAPYRTEGTWPEAKSNISTCVECTGQKVNAIMMPSTQFVDFKWFLRVLLKVHMLRHSRLDSR